MDDSEHRWDSVQPIVGESHYQQTLRQLRDAELETFTATLHPEPENPDDPQAVAVLGPMRQHVGYLPRPVAARVHQRLGDRAGRGQPLTCPAKLIGGSEDKPVLGVLLAGSAFKALTGVPSEWRSSAHLEIKRCPFCAEEILAAAVVCKHCGRDLRLGVTPPGVSTSWKPGVAALLSLLIPGAGQLYKGQIGIGLIWFVAVIAGYVTFVVPGLLLHLVCIVTAASGHPAQARRVARTTDAPPPPPFRLSRRARHVLFGAIVLYVLLWMIALMVQRSDRTRRPATQATTAADISAEAPTAMRTQQIKTTRGVFTVSGPAFVDGRVLSTSPGRDVSVWTTLASTESRCALPHGIDVDLIAARRPDSNGPWYFQVRRGECVGFIVETALSVKALKP